MAARPGGTGGFKPEHLRMIAEHIRRDHPDGGARIIETGAGNSTLTFLHLDPARVVSVAYDDELERRIRDAGSDLGAPVDRLEYHSGRSELVLPTVTDGDARYDVALIDGGHGWPTVFVDFCYLNSVLAKGALLLIDDVSIYAIAELTRLLDAEPDFERIDSFGKLEVWRKTSGRRFLPGHSEQPYVMERTRRDRWRRRLRLR